MQVQGLFKLQSYCVCLYRPQEWHSLLISRLTETNRTLTPYYTHSSAPLHPRGRHPKPSCFPVRPSVRPSARPSVRPSAGPHSWRRAGAARSVGGRGRAPRRRSQGQPLQVHGQRKTGSRPCRPSRAARCGRALSWAGWAPDGQMDAGTAGWGSRGR